MSIASEEAEYRYPDDLDLYPGSSTEEAETCRKMEIRAFEQGADLQAEQQPTEAEIEAGAIAIFTSVTSSSYHMSEDNYLQAWECQMEAVKKQFRRQSRLALEAARKVVAK